MRLSSYSVDVQNPSLDGSTDTVHPKFEVVIDFSGFLFPKTKQEYAAMSEETKINETSASLNMTWYGSVQRYGGRWDAYTRTYPSKLTCKKPFVIRKSTIQYSLEREVSPEFCFKKADKHECSTFEVKHDGDDCDVVIENQEFRGPLEESRVQATVYARYFKASNVPHFSMYTGSIFQITSIKLH